MNNPELQVHTLKCDELVPYAGNAKVHTPEQVEQIAASIREFGNCDPIAVWHDQDGAPVIVEGHGRLMALQKLGIETAPVIYLDHLTDEQRRAYTHVHNQTTLSSGFDLDALAADMADLPAVDWASFGFNSAMVDSFTSETEEVEVPEEAAPRVKAGEVWQLGDHRLMCGDSSDGDAVRILVAGGGAPMMVFTDPPYGVAIGDKNAAINAATFGVPGGRIEKNIEGDTMGTDELYSLLVKCFTNLREVCDQSCTYYVSSPQGGELGLMMMMMMRDAGLPVRHNLVWKKNNATFSMGRLDYDYKHEPIFYTWTKSHRFYGQNETTVLEFDKPRESKLHPTMKPIPLVAHLMSNSSRPGDWVADIFGGSGTTLMAAEQLGRKCYMMELDPHYCDVIIERWEQFTGKKAVLL